MSSPPAVREKPYKLEPVKGGALPDHAKLLSAALQDLIDNIGPYVLASLGLTVVTVPLVFVLIFVVYAVLGIGGFVGIGGVVVLASLVPQDYAGLVVAFGQLGVMVVMMFVMFALIGAMGAALAPLNASYWRGIVKHQRGEGGLDFMSPFSTITENALGSIVLQAMLTAGVLIGLMLCYLPGLVFGFATAFALPLVAIHKRAPAEAISIAFSHTRENLTWHAIWFGLNFVVGIAAAYVPVLGPAFMMALQVRAYREIFGDGEEPVLGTVA